MKKQSTILLLPILLFVVVAWATEDEEIIADKISDEVLVIKGGGANVTAISTDNGLVVVDTFTTPASARVARKLIEEFSSQPIRYVINTHFHADHSYGNQVFSDAVIIGYKNYVKYATARYGEDRLASIEEAIRELQQQLKTVDPDTDESKMLTEAIEIRQKLLIDSKGFVLTEPAISLCGSATIHLGGKTFKILHYGCAHTDTDLTIFVPEVKLLVTGDIFWDTWTPYIDPVESDPQNWIDTLDKLLTLDGKVQHIVPGHGNVREFEALRVQRDYLDELLCAVSSARDRDLSLEQAKAEIAMEKYDDYKRHYSRLPFIIESCWRYLERTKS